MLARGTGYSRSNRSPIPHNHGTFNHALDRLGLYIHGHCSHGEVYAATLGVWHTLYRRLPTFGNNRAARQRPTRIHRDRSTSTRRDVYGSYDSRRSNWNCDARREIRAHRHRCPHCLGLATVDYSLSTPGRRSPLSADVNRCWVGLIGLFLILIPGGTVPISGASNTQVALWSVAIACGSFCWAFFSWRSTSYQQPKNPLTTAVIQLATAGVFLTLVGVLIGETWNFGIITQQSWAGWAFLVFASSAAYGAYVWLINNAPMSLVTTHAYVNPMVAVTLGFLILKEAYQSGCSCRPVHRGRWSCARG